MSRGLRARLYDADGRDAQVSVAPNMVDALKDRQLLWIDVLGRQASDLEAVVNAAGIGRRLAARLASDQGRAALTQYQDQIHLVLEALESPTASADDGGLLERREIEMVAGRNWVVTVHTQPVSAVERIDDLTEGETRFGALDAAGFLALIVDEVVAGYLTLAETIEQEIDRLDERALRSKPRDDVLVTIVALRRRIGMIRRTLTPHRHVIAALMRPEMQLHEEFGRPWPGLNDRLERAIDAIENLRGQLMGSYDIHMGRAAHDANEVMKRLTLLSAVLLPAVVLAGIMGMNFGMAFFEDANNFWLVVGTMGVFGATLLGVARWRSWL